MSSKSLTAGWCIVKKKYGLCAILSKPVFTPPFPGRFETNQNPRENQCFWEWLNVFELSFEVRNQGLSHSSFSLALTQIKGDRFEGTIWVCVLLRRITIKRSACRCGVTLPLLPCGWSSMRSLQERAFFPISKWEPGPNLLLEQQRPEAGGQDQIALSQGKWVLSGYRALSTDRNE